MAEPATILSALPTYVREAVKFYWRTRVKQVAKQKSAGGTDQGLRSAVTGGAQMDGFIELLTKLVIEAGIDRSHIFYRRGFLELPGYFRPTKQWDFIVVVKGQLEISSFTPRQRRSCRQPKRWHCTRVRRNTARAKLQRGRGAEEAPTLSSWQPAGWKSDLQLACNSRLRGLGREACRCFSAQGASERHIRTLNPAANISA